MYVYTTDDEINVYVCIYIYISEYFSISITSFLIIIGASEWWDTSRLLWVITIDLSLPSRLSIIISGFIIIIDLKLISIIISSFNDNRLEIGVLGGHRINLLLSSRRLLLLLLFIRFIISDSDTGSINFRVIECFEFIEVSSIDFIGTEHFFDGWIECIRVSGSNII